MAEAPVYVAEAPVYVAEAPAYVATRESLFGNQFQPNWSQTTKFNLMEIP